MAEQPVSQGVMCWCCDHAPCDPLAAGRTQAGHRHAALNGFVSEIQHSTATSCSQVSVEITEEHSKGSTGIAREVTLAEPDMLAMQAGDPQISVPR